MNVLTYLSIWDHPKPHLESVFFWNFWLIHNHFSSEWASNKIENKSSYYKCQRKIESLLRTVFILGPLCVFPTLNGCILKGSQMLWERIRQTPVPARSVPGTALASLSLALVFSGNCWWDSSKRGSSQHCLVLFLVSLPIFPKLSSEDTRPGELSFCEASIVWALKPVATIPENSEFSFCQKHLHLVCSIARGGLKPPSWGTARGKIGWKGKSNCVTSSSSLHD